MLQCIYWNSLELNKPSTSWNKFQTLFLESLSSFDETTCNWRLEGSSIDISFIVLRSYLPDINIYVAQNSLLSFEMSA